MLSDSNEIYIGGILQHIEQAGVHSGDSAMLIPPKNISKNIIDEIEETTLKLALKLNYEILSLDSLSIYKEIDIASAKPTPYELSLVKHYGINEIYPNEHFNVSKFIEILKNIPHKNIIIVGGTGFYLKTLISGISEMPNITEEMKKEAKKLKEQILEYESENSSFFQEINFDLELM